MEPARSAGSTTGFVLINPLIAISVELGNDIGVIQLDQASAHTAQAMVCPDNIVLVFQPPHGPELNPIERSWLFLKQHLAWQNCPSFDQLRQLLASELEAIAPERIASLTSYTFILEALFGAISYWNGIKMTVMPSLGKNTTPGR